MKQRQRFSTVLAIALLSATAALTTRSQTWDTYLPQPTSENYGFQVLIDPFSADPANPAVFVGYQSAVYAEGSILRMEPTSATTYSVTVVDSDLLTAIRMGYNPVDSTLYAVGSRPLVTTPPFPRSNPNVWCVRKSSAGGALSTWTDADTFSLNSKEGASAYGFATDVAGNVYVCGDATLKGYPHWIVRRKLASGGGWTTVSDLSSKSSALAVGMCHFPGNASRNLQPALFVVGILNNKWTVQRLEQNGSWTTVDPGPLTCEANTVTCDNNGNIFVAGYRGGGLAGMAYGWVVRMSANGGNTWTTVLDVSEGYFSGAGSVAADRDGNIWVSGFTGSTADIKSQPRWTVVRHSPLESWSDSWTSRQHQFDGASNSRARGIATDAYGHVFVTGGVGDFTDGFTTWAGPRIVVQRLMP